MVIILKITEVDKETKKSKKDYILPIASAGIGLGLTCFLMQTGVVNYNNFIDLDTVGKAIDNIPVLNSLPGYTDMVLKITKGVLDTVGLQGIILASKSLNLAKEVIQPIKDSEKFKNSKIHHVIQNVKKMGGKEEKETEQDDKYKSSKAFLNLAKNALGIGARTFLIATHQIDYNAVFDFSKLPHKFAKIADVAKNIDMNKVLIGIDTVKSVGSFVKGRISEKKEGNIPLVNFKGILHNIGESMKNTAKFPTIKTLQSIGKEMEAPSIEMEASARNKGER